MTPTKAPAATPATPATPNFARIRTDTVLIGELREHPQHLDMPMDTEAFEALCDDVHVNGVTNRLLVAQAEVGYEVLAGNQRLKAAKVVGLEKIPVEIIEAEDPVSVMLADNVLGRARTKSAIALQVFLYYRAELVAGEAGKAKQVAGLKKGSSPLSNIRQRENIGVSARSLSEKYGFDCQLLLDLADILRMCQEDEDQDKAKENWGEAVAAISSGAVSTARAKAGMGSRIKTLGKKRGDPKWYELVDKSAITLGHCWEHWEDIGPNKREKFCSAFAKSLAYIPDDGIKEISKVLPKWSNSQLKTISDAAIRELKTRRTKLAKTRGVA